MRVKTYLLLSDKVEEGIRGGLNKAEKREYVRVNQAEDALIADTSSQNYEAAVEEIHRYVMNAVEEYFDWTDEEVPEEDEWYPKGERDGHD